MKYLIRFIFLITLVSIGQSVFSQSKYWVYFTDKNGVSFNPYEYFDAKAIERRQLNGISLYDSTDYPVNSNYISSVKERVDSITKASRWFNCLAVYATYEQVKELENLKFVKSVEPMYYYPFLAEYDTVIKDHHKKILDGQTQILGREYFEEKGIDGKGIRIAIFDGGFPGVDTHPAFAHIRDDKRIIKTWDFTKNKENAYCGISHGTNVMSCIGGEINGKKIGLATGAEFLLARTEVRMEPYSEEENWLAAVEWADKNGADIINSSLGYTYDRYFPEQMDGKHSLVAKAGNLAAKKGILVVNAAGNDGTDDWKIIGTPADADSVLSIGGITPYTGYHTSFSSYGPTSDGRLKPNVCAYGHVIAAGKNDMHKTQGTSFSSPLVAGFAACAWQLNPDKTNMEMFHEIEKSASLYPYFDYAHGYGVPHAKYFTDTITEVESTFEINVKSDKLIIKLSDIVEGEYFYYNVQEENKVLKEYFVLKVEQKKVLELDLEDFKKGETINFHYLDYTESYNIKN